MISVSCTDYSTKGLKEVGYLDFATTVYVFVYATLHRTITLVKARLSVNYITLANIISFIMFSLNNSFTSSKQTKSAHA